MNGLADFFLAIHHNHTILRKRKRLEELAESYSTSHTAAMRFIHNILVTALLALPALATSTEQRPVIVTYPESTPDKIIEEAMEAVRQAGGKITHEYNLIRGFAAHVSDEMLDIVHSLGDGQHAPTIEEDKIVSINGHE